MASLAKGVSLSLGLIGGATVRVEAAKERAESFKTLCVGQGGTSHAPSTITYAKTCPTCGPITDHSTLKKGRPSGDGFIVVEESEIKQLKDTHSAAFKKVISLTPHPADQVATSTAQGEKLYYLVPESGNDRYALLAQLIEDHPEYAFMLMWTARSVATMYVARVTDGVIVLEERVHQSHLKARPVVDATPDAALMAMASQVLPAMTKDFDPVTYEDGYATALNDLLTSRETTTGGTVATTSAPSVVPDANAELIAALAALVQASSRRNA